MARPTDDTESVPERTVYRAPLFSDAIGSRNGSLQKKGVGSSVGLGLGSSKILGGLLAVLAVQIEYVHVRFQASRALMQTSRFEFRSLSYRILRRLSGFRPFTVRPLTCLKLLPSTCLFIQTLNSLKTYTQKKQNDGRFERRQH